MGATPMEPEGRGLTQQRVMHCSYTHRCVQALWCVVQWAAFDAAAACRHSGALYSGQPLVQRRHAGTLVHVTPTLTQRLCTHGSPTPQESSTSGFDMDAGTPWDVVSWGVCGGRVSGAARKVEEQPSVVDVKKVA